MIDCVNCRLHETYYTKCGIKFYREKVGKCFLLQKTTENHDRCDGWKRKYSEGHRNLNKRNARHYLEKISEDLSQIAQILEEDAEERREEEREKA